MLQAFIIVAREGLESFLIVAVLFSYLRKSGRHQLLPAVKVGIGASVLASSALAFVLMKIANNSLLEGILGAVTAVLVASMIVHMWRLGPSFKKEMEQKLSEASSKPAEKSALIGVFLLTVFLVTREGMETALMLFQVKNGRFILGSFLGLIGASIISYFWVRYSHLINLRRFFQVTGIYLIFFMLQVALTAFHELCEAGVFPNSETWHAATEPYSPDGTYGKWFSFIFVVGMALWLLIAAVHDRTRRKTSEPALP